MRSIDTTSVDLQPSQQDLDHIYKLPERKSKLKGQNKTLLEGLVKQMQARLSSKKARNNNTTINNDKVSFDC